MRKLEKAELEKKRIIKAVRVNIRLKYSLMADEEINERIPEIEKMVDAAIQAGVAFELDIRSVLEDEEDAA